MFCHHCGRPNEKNCVCLKSNPLSKLEALALLIGFQITTGLVSFIVFYTMQLNFMSGIPYLSITIFVYLVLISFLTLIFNKSYLAMFFGCHQASNRSFKLKGKPLNICSRCTGIFVGFLIPILWFYFEAPPILIILMGVPLMVDGFAQQYSSYVSNQTRRLITGLLFSSLIALIVTGYNYLIIISLSQII